MSAVPDITVDPRAGSARDVVEAPTVELTVDYLVSLAMQAATRAAQSQEAFGSGYQKALEAQLRERMAQAAQVHVLVIGDVEAARAAAVADLAKATQRLDRMRSDREALRITCAALAQRLSVEMTGPGR